MMCGFTKRAETIQKCAAPSQRAQGTPPPETSPHSFSPRTGLDNALKIDRPTLQREVLGNTSGHVGAKPLIETKGAPGEQEGPRRALGCRDERLVSSPSEEEAFNPAREIMDITSLFGACSRGVHLRSAEQASKLRVTLQASARRPITWEFTPFISLKFFPLKGLSWLARLTLRSVLCPRRALSDVPLRGWTMLTIRQN